MKALCFDMFGDPEVLSYRELPQPSLQPGHALVRTRAIGLNYADIYRRRGNYHLVGNPPYILGYEAAGEVVAVGPGEAPVREGDRVAFADSPHANAERVAVPFDRLIPIPADISFELAAASLLQGLTAHYLVHDSHPLQPGETALIHAAAGGVGSLLVQLCKLKGARVMGLTSSEAKRQRVEELGADAVALYSDDWGDAARVFSGVRGGMDVVYDSVGSTLRQSLDAARIGGRVVFYGMAGGDPAPIDPRLLMDTSKTLTGGDLWNVLTSRAERLRRSAELFDWIRKDRLKVEISRAFPLSEGAQAHRFLESRQSTGKLLLIP